MTAAHAQCDYLHTFGSHLALSIQLRILVLLLRPRIPASHFSILHIYTQVSTGWRSAVVIKEYTARNEC